MTARAATARFPFREHRTMAQVIADEAAQDPAHDSPSCARAGTLPGTTPFVVATAARAGDFSDSNHDGLNTPRGQQDHA